MTTASLLLTIPEAAAELRLSRWAVYDLISAGELDATNVASKTSGRTKMRVPRAALEAFIEARTCASPRKAS